MQERVVREIRMLRAMWREPETGLRRLLHGHEGGNPGYSQGAAYGLPRQFPTLPVTPSSHGLGTSDANLRQHRKASVRIDDEQAAAADRGRRRDPRAEIRNC